MEHRDPKFWEELPRLENPKSAFARFLWSFNEQNIEWMIEESAQLFYTLAHEAKELSLKDAVERYENYQRFLENVFEAESLEEVQKDIETFELKMPDMIVISNYLEDLLDD